MRTRTGLVLLCLAVLTACSPDSPETRIKKAFDASVRAVEAGDAAGASKVLSPAFTGPEGMDRAGARLFLAGLLREEKVGVTVFSQKIAVEGSLAVQSVDLLVTGRTGGSLLPGDRSRETLVLRWELRDGDWALRELQQE